MVKNNKLILKANQRLKSIMFLLKSEKHNVFTKEINKIALSSNNVEECNHLIP